MNYWSSLSMPRMAPALPALGIAASVTFASCLYLGHLYGKISDDIIESPLPQIRELPLEEQARLPYPPDVLPGVRDVNSPYGNIRVYEWGPEDGRKVLLVHGISTPGIALGSLAEELVESGCRVMLFDLFGRGYSSAPNPDKHPQDIKLFTSQILLVLASSPISWTGSEAFTLIGYSLGGGIATTFTSYFPSLVDSLILIAPAGLMRPSRFHWTSRFIYGGLLPSSLVTWLVWRRLGGNSKAPPKANNTSPPSSQVKATDMVEEEMAPHPALSRDSSAPLSARRPSVSVADAVDWQLRSHRGFLPAFISSIQHAPISNQHDLWRLIGARLAAQRAEPNTENRRQGLREGRVLVILGKADDVVLTAETGEDVKKVFGADFVHVRVMEGGHDLPVASAGHVAKTILDFWDRHVM